MEQVASAPARAPHLYSSISPQSWRSNLEQHPTCLACRSTVQLCCFFSGRRSRSPDCGSCLRDSALVNIPPGKCTPRKTTCPVHRTCSDVSPFTRKRLHWPSCVEEWIPRPTGGFYFNLLKYMPMYIMPPVIHKVGRDIILPSAHGDCTVRSVLRLHSSSYGHNRMRDAPQRTCTSFWISSSSSPFWTRPRVGPRDRGTGADVATSVAHPRETWL